MTLKASAAGPALVVAMAPCYICRQKPNNQSPPGRRLLLWSLLPLRTLGIFCFCSPLLAFRETDRLGPHISCLLSAGIAPLDTLKAGSQKPVRTKEEALGTSQGSWLVTLAG